MSVDMIITAIVALLAVLNSLGMISVPGISKKIAEKALSGQKYTGMAKSIVDANDKLLTDAAADFGDGSIESEDLKHVFENAKTIADLISGINGKLK